MTKPSTKIEFATDGGALLADPGSPKRHAGFVVDEAVPAHWLNWLFRNITDWIEFLNLSGTDELTYANTRTRTVLVPFSAGCPTDTTTTGECFVPGPGGGLTLQNSSWTMPVELPQDSVLKSIKISCVPDVGASAGVVSATLRSMTINRGTFTNSATTLASDAASGIGAAPQDLAMTGLSVSIDRANSVYFVEISSSTDAAALDQFRHFEIVYEEMRATGHH